MPDLITSIDYLADLELYKTEKPYAVVVSPENHDESIETNNLVFESREGLTITDIRGHENDISLETSGFTVTPNKSQLSNVESWDEIRAYQKETEQFLKDWFQADSVFCFDLKLRKNEPVTRLVKDLRDWTIPDAPAYGAHNDVTFDSGPMIIDNNLPTDLKEKYLQPGYRFRIVNTWRCLLPVLEDSPLALCDFRTINKDDLVACDRVIPTRNGEVYYLKFNPNQRWYWLEHMTPEEPFLFIMYDSIPNGRACFCPHVPVKNPRAPATAPRRRSIETRSIIITKTN